MLMNAAQTQLNGFSRLRSPQTNMGSQESEACLTFWYYMYGTSVNKIEVRLEANNVVNAPIWYNGGKAIMYLIQKKNENRCCIATL